MTMLKRIFQFFPSAKREREMANITNEHEERIEQLHRELLDLKHHIPEIMKQDLVHIANAQKGDRHPRFRNLKIRQYDIDYAIRMLQRMETYQDHEEQ